MLMDLARAQIILKRERIDALISNRPENITYIGGFSHPLECRFNRETRAYALIFASQPPALVVPWFEIFSVRSQSEVEEIVADQVWLEAPSPEKPEGQLRGSVEASVARVVGEHRLASGRIGIDEMALPVGAYWELRRQLPEAEIVPATRVFEEMRMVKTPAEIALIEKSARAVEQGYEAIAASLWEGVTERELTLRARAAILAAGADDIVFSFVTFGSRTGIDHVAGADVPLRPGDVVKCDIGARFGGYCSDIGRTFACGELSPEHRRIYRRVLETHERVLAAARPGATGADLYQIYLEGMQGGYGDLPWNMIGHGIGLEVHEAPMIGPLDRRPFEPGMVLCVEFGYLDPGRHGNHLEDMILIGEDGYRPLSSLPRDYALA